MSTKLDYANKIIAAPMVRISSLPFRLLCLDYGCDLVYSEEIIDFRLLRSKRIYNEMLDTIDFIDDDHTVVFRTCLKEKSRLVVQLGTADPDRALQAAKIVEQDVSGIDVNMGCPKSFSCKGGMGAALLSDPDKIERILTNLVNNLSVPVSCKIRVLNTKEDTLKLVERILKTGISALAVHGRTKDERPQHLNRDDFIQFLSSHVVDVPLIANGGSGQIDTYADIVAFKEKTKANSVMVARAAEQNCSVFRKQGKLELDQVICDFLRYAVRYESYIANVKYTVQNMLGNLQDTPKGKKLLASQSVHEICTLWEMDKEYDQITKELHSKLSSSKQDEQMRKRELSCDLDDLQKAKKTRFADVNLNLPTENVAGQMCCKFVRRLFELNSLPKSCLLRFTYGKCDIPKYTTIAIDKHFYTICEVDGKRYINSYLEKNKKFAEQGAALVACKALNLIDEKIIYESLLS